MRVCPECKTRLEDEVRKCPFDGRRPLPESVVAASPGDSLLGCTISGRYTVVDRLGSGGMGTVYRAEQAPMGREVALKVLRRDLGRDPETAARFHREARTLSQLKHPNTVTIFDFGQTSDGLLYLAMELLEGEMLSSRMKREGGLSVEQSVKVAAGVLRSLAEAHARGIIHRDLKPDNIFIAKVHARGDESEVVKVVDFGIAKIRDGENHIDALQTQEGTVFGTPRYMSPEQAQGKTLDGRSDLYAVGVLLFHMLTGHPPFTDDDAVIVMAHHIKTVPPPVRKVMPHKSIPESLEALVQRAMGKDPLKRPQTADDFLVELEAIANEVRVGMTLSTVALPTLSDPNPPATEVASPPAPPATKAGAPNYLLAALLALAALGATGGWWLTRRAVPVVATALPVARVPAALLPSPAPPPAPVAEAQPTIPVEPPPAPPSLAPSPALPPLPPAPPAVVVSSVSGARAGRTRAGLRPRGGIANAPPPSAPPSPVAANPGARDPNGRYPQWRD